MADSYLGSTDRSAEKLELQKIDFGIRMNYCLVRDGPHPAVDYKAVWAHIDSLLDRRLVLER